jgi:arylsulfatase
MFWLMAAVVLGSLLLFFSCNKKVKKVQVILISVDTLRGDHITPFGYSRDTSPNLSRLAEDSAYFKNAYTNGCWTMPSHMSILTGTLPSRHGVNMDWYSFSRKEYPQLHESVKTIPELLKAHNPGISTVKFAKLSSSLGFGRGYDVNNSLDPFLYKKDAEKLLNQIENHKQKDFFLFVHTWLVHAPYTNTHFLENPRVDEQNRSHIDNFRRMTKKDRRELVGKKTKKMGGDFRVFLKKNKIFNREDCVALYDSGIHYVDRYIGKIVEKAKQLGIYDDLMIVVVADHGEHFEEHVKNMFYDYHGFAYYEEFVKVPLIIKFPRRYKQEVLSDPVSMIDVVPTILDYYDIPVPGYIQGESLLKPYSKRKRKYIVSESVSGPGMEGKMLRFGDWKLIVNMKKPNQPGRVNWKRVIKRKLYDMAKDPQEQTNLFKNPKFKNTALRLEKILKSIIERSVKAFGPGKSAKVDQEMVEHMKSLGYL